MPTLDDLITATQTKLTAVEAQITTLRQALKDDAQQLDVTERRRALLKTRLEALQVLAGEP